MSDDLPKEEAERRATEPLRRLLTTPKRQDGHKAKPHKQAREGEGLPPSKGRAHIQSSG